MIPVTFEEANASFGAPEDMHESQCMTIEGFMGEVRNPNSSLDGQRIIVVAWKPSIEEITIMQMGNPIYLSFVGGIPPHFPCMTFQEATNPA